MSMNPKAITILLLPLWAPLAIAGADKKIEPVNLGGDAISSGGVMQMLFGLIVIVALIIAMAWVMRRMGTFQGSANGNMKVISALSLGQRERALLVQVGDTQLLIGTAPGSVRTLHVFDEPVIISDNKDVPSFADSLSSAMKQKVNK